MKQRIKLEHTFLLSGNHKRQLRSCSAAKVKHEASRAKHVQNIPYQRQVRQIKLLEITGEKRCNTFNKHC